VVAKGKRVIDLDPRSSAPEEISALVLGPTGNLRAPALKLGKTWLVGFNEEAYGELIG